MVRNLHVWNKKSKVNTKSLYSHDKSYILDGGCTRSQTGSMNDLSKVRPDSRIVKMANDTHLRTYAEGEVGHIKHISYTPGIHRLLSENALIQQGYGIIKMDLRSAKIVCRKTGKVKGEAYLSNGLWRIDPEKIDPLDENVYKAHPEYTLLASVQEEDRLQHFENILFMPQKAMLQLKLAKAVKGFDVKKKSLQQQRPINQSLALGSMTRVPVHRKRKDKEKPEIGHTIVCDLYGKVRTPGLEGHQYYAFCLDKGGGLGEVYPVKHKHEGFQQVQTYIAYKESLGEEPKVFESGQDTELVNKDSIKWLAKHKIHRQSGAAFKHQHTASINVHIRHTMNLARAMMMFSKDKPLGFKPALYPYAVIHANYIRDRTRLVERNGVKKTRYEWSTNKKPDLSNLCYWGCIGYRTVPPDLHIDKQQSKCEVGYFMGYDSNTKGTRIYIPGKKKIIVSGDFIFDELATDAWNYILQRQTQNSDNTDMDLSLIEVEKEIDREVMETVPETDNENPLKRHIDDRDNVVPVKLRRSNRDVPVADYRPPTVKRKYKNGSEYSKLVQDYSNNVEDDEDIEQCSDENIVIDEAMLLRQAIEYVNEITISNEPGDVLRNGPDGKKWRDADKVEFDSFRRTKSLKLVPRPRDKKIHKFKVIRGIKTSVTGEKRYKTRCVLRGHTMRYGIDYHETFSPTVRYETLRQCLALAVQLGLDIHHVDFDAAFLNTKIDEEVYAEIPEGYDYKSEARKLGFKSNADLVVKLVSAVYGTPQANRNWYKILDDIFTKEGFQSFSKDKCIYIRKNNNGHICILIVYVDDLLIIGKDDDHMKQFKDVLKKYYPIKDIGRVQEFLGMRVSHDNNSVSLDLEKYIDKMLKRFNMTDSKPSTIPMDPSQILSKEQCTKTEEEKMP